MNAYKEKVLRKVLRSIKIGYQEPHWGILITRWDDDHYTVGIFAEKIIDEDRAVEILGAETL